MTLLFMITNNQRFVFKVHSKYIDFVVYLYIFFPCSWMLENISDDSIIIPVHIVWDWVDETSFYLSELCLSFILISGFCNDFSIACCEKSISSNEFFKQFSSKKKEGERRIEWHDDERTKGVWDKKRILSLTINIIIKRNSLFFFFKAFLTWLAYLYRKSSYKWPILSWTCNE